MASFAIYQSVSYTHLDVYKRQGIPCYITRGRVGERKREKDAEKRNNKITVELQMRKRQQEERDKKMCIRDRFCPTHIHVYGQSAREANRYSKDYFCYLRRHAHLPLA